MPTPRRKGRRRREDDKGPDLEGVFAKIADLFTDGKTWIKIAVAVGAIVVAMWGFFGFGDRLDRTDARISRVTQRVAENEERLEELERIDDKLNRLNQEADDLDDALFDIKRAIRSAIADAIRKERARRG